MQLHIIPAVIFVTGESSKLYETFTPYLKGCGLVILFLKLIKYFWDMFTARVLHCFRAFADSVDPVERPSLYATLEGVDRLKKKDVGKTCPITPAMLLKFSQTVPISMVGAAMWACVLIIRWLLLEV